MTATTTPRRSRPRNPPAVVVSSVFRFRNALTRLRRRCAPASAVVAETAIGVADTVAIRTLAHLRIADFLDDGPLSAAALAARCELDEARLHRLLRFLVSRGFLGMTRDGRFSNNRISRQLRSKAPDSMRQLPMFAGAPAHLVMWSHFDATLRGESAATAAFGHPMFQQFETDVEFGQVFHGAMEALSRLQATALLGAHDFSGVTHVCDVGGGTGTLLAEVLRHHAALQGTLFDLPEVVAHAGPVMEKYDIADRVRTVGGSFFESVPTGADRYLLQSIVHDWGDDACVEILSRVREAMGQDGRALVIEQPLPDRRSDHPSRYLDIEMMVSTEGGQERTRSEYRTLFERAGFQIRKKVEVLPLTIFELAPYR